MIEQIEESYVALETAKLLKEKGFDYRCRKYYIDGSMFEHTHGEIIPKNYDIYECPTQQMAMKWLREKFNIVISIIFISDQKREDRNSFSWIVYTADTFKWNTKEAEKSQVSYELACEAAIKYCLENLI
jgi:hypothetical protein